MTNYTYPNSHHFRVHNRWQIVTYPNSLHFPVHNRWQIITYPNSLHFRVHNRWEIITYPNSLHLQFVTFVSVVVHSHQPTQLAWILCWWWLCIFFLSYFFLPAMKAWQVLHQNWSCFESKPPLLQSSTRGLHKWMTHVVDNKSIIPQECQTPFGIAKPWSPPFLVLLLLLLLLQSKRWHFGEDARASNLWGVNDQPSKVVQY